MNRVTTLDQFIVDEERRFPAATGNLSGILRHIALASKMVQREVSKAGLVDILGKYGTTNVHGEEVKKIDVCANEAFIQTLSDGQECAAIISEEEEDIRRVPVTANARYIVAIDPLDGSSNIDINGPVGTIFSILLRTHDGVVDISECLQPGVNQVAAGYILYGSSTMLVYTTGKGVHGFTLDPSIGEYCLSHPKMNISECGKTYSVNEGNFGEFSMQYHRLINWFKQNDKETGRPYSLRYFGALVSDIHRTLIDGGIFLYPPTQKHSSGKLRLIYECNPMSFLVEQGGGASSDGSVRVMVKKPSFLHERSPLVIGSKEMVENAIRKLGE